MLSELLERHVAAGTVPGAVALVASGGDAEVVAAGAAALAGGPPMARDTVFRIASVTKPVTAAAVMMLVDDGVLALDDPVARFLPEIASPVVVRTPSSRVDDVVPAFRPITVEDVLSSRAGWGFPADFHLPAVGLLFSELNQGSPLVQAAPATDEWLARLARIPLLRQPGEAWLYNICSDLQGILVARASGRTLPEFLAERVFAPLGMADTGFVLRPDQRDRFTSLYRPSNGGLALVDPPDGQWATMPPLASGAGGLLSTVDDVWAFFRALAGGDLLSRGSRLRMVTDQLTPTQRAAGRLFLEGQGWGYGGSVDIAPVDPWNRPGRYGWVGGTGTCAHVIPSTGAVAVLLTQCQMTSPTPPAIMRDFWAYAA